MSSTGTIKVVESIFAALKGRREMGGSRRSRRTHIQDREVATQTISYNRHISGCVNTYIRFFNEDIGWNIMKDVWPLWPSGEQ